MTETTTARKQRLTRESAERGEALALAAIAHATSGNLSTASKITALEALITPRRLREAVMGYVESGHFVQAVDDAIRKLRG